MTLHAIDTGIDTGPLIDVQYIPTCTGMSQWFAISLRFGSLSVFWLSLVVVNVGIACVCSSDSYFTIQTELSFGMSSSCSVEVLRCISSRGCYVNHVLPYRC